MGHNLMTDTGAVAARRPFKVYQYRGIECGELATRPLQDVFALMNSRKRRRATRGLTEAEVRFYNKCQEAVRNCVPGEKPAVVRTMKRNIIVVPQMIGSIVQVYNGMKFVTIEIKPEMISLYLGEMAVSKKTVNHLKARSSKKR